MLWNNIGCKVEVLPTVVSWSANVSEMYSPEDRGTIFLRNVGIVKILHGTVTL